MRQAGIVAAGALHALEHHQERMIQDHSKAAYLADVLSALPGVIVLPQETNIVIADLVERGLSQEPIVEQLAAEGVSALGFGATRFRLVTHLDIDDDHIARAAQVIKKVLA